MATTTSPIPTKSVDIDEEGFAAFGDTRVTDDEVGHELLKNISFREPGIWVTELYGEVAMVNAFDRPLVATQVEPIEADRWTAIFPYGFRAEFSLKTLRVDDWDRFHGFTTAKVQFVFSRTAQAEIFRLAEDFDDDSLSFQGERYEVPYLYQERDDIDEAHFWSERYNGNDTPWDLDAPHPEFAKVLHRIKLSKSRVLIPGAGRAHDALPFVEGGNIVTAMDFSDAAVNDAKKAYGQYENLTIEQGDALNLPQSSVENFDVVAEHTLFCAVDPKKRKKLTQQWSKVLVEQGYLIGIFAIHPSVSGPPYGSTQWEIRELLKKNFRFLLWERIKDSPGHWPGKELLILAQKK